MKQPVITVTITSYNYGKFIGKAIQSILAQSFQDFEVIVVDDASTDNSVEVIQAYAEKDSRIKFIRHEKNQGATRSLIEASNLARGEFLVNVDSDDWVSDRDAFMLQVEMFRSDPQIVMVYSLQAFYRSGVYTRYMQPYTEDTVLPGELAVEKVMAFYLAHTGTMVRRSIYLAVGGYNANYKFTLDLKLWIDMCGKGKVGYINQQLYTYNQHNSSMSWIANPRLWQCEILRPIEEGFKGPLAHHFKANPALRRKIFQHALVAGSLHFIFTGDYKHGWQLYLASFRMHPLATLLQKDTLVLISRTLLSERGFLKFKSLYYRSTQLLLPDRGKSGQSD